MTKAEAEAEIQLLTDYQKAPALTEDHIAHLVAKARAVVNGVPADVGSDSFSNSLLVARAVAQGWKIKAGLVATAYDFASDQQKFSRSQMQKGCLEMAKYWESEAKRLRGSPRSGTLTKPDTTKLLG